jgi:hypothetical protein
MSKLLVFVSLFALPLGFVGCGSNSRPSTADDGRGHGASYACGTTAAPVTFVLRDVAPAAGTTVTNRSIVEKYTLVDPPFMITTGLSFELPPEHTAGTPNPLTPQPTFATDGKDHVYSITVDSWSKSPGHVEMRVTDVLLSDNGCAFVFPSPLFSYDITSP